MCVHAICWCVRVAASVHNLFGCLTGLTQSKLQIHTFEVSTPRLLALYDHVEVIHIHDDKLKGCPMGRECTHVFIICAGVAMYCIMRAILRNKYSLVHSFIHQQTLVVTRTHSDSETKWISSDCIQNLDKWLVTCFHRSEGMRIIGNDNPITFK